VWNGSCFPGGKLARLEGNHSTPLPTSRKCGVELLLRRIIF
jgi:hypothetical protein